MCGRLTVSTRRPRVLEEGDALPDSPLDVGVHAGHEVLARQPEAPAPEPGDRLVVRSGRWSRSSGTAIGADVESRASRPAIACSSAAASRRVPGERSDLVQRRGERDDPVAADPAVGGLHADDPAQRRRLADRTAGVGPERQRRVMGRHDGRGTAAATAGDGVEVPRVADRAVGRVLVRRAHRELVHVRLAEEDGAGRPEPLRDVGVVGRAIALEDSRPGGALAALDADEVLERDRDAVERMEPARGRLPVPTRSRRAGRRRRRPGARAPVAVDGQPRIERMVLALGRVEMGDRELARGDVARAHRDAPSRARTGA